MKACKRRRPGHFPKRRKKYRITYGFENGKISVKLNATEMSLLWNVGKNIRYRKGHLSV